MQNESPVQGKNLSVYTINDWCLFTVSLAWKESFHRLKRKLSLHVLREFNKMYSVHGANKLQSDNGGEFEKHVKVYFHRNNIKIIRCVSYNPRVQWQVERSHRKKSVTAKISYDLINRTKVGVNWAIYLPRYMECLNNKGPWMEKPV